MRRGFGINSILFLSFVLITIVAWTGFEIYHRRSNLDIPAKTLSESQKSLPSSFDSETLKSFYANKDKLYEYSDDSNQ